jgi:hypothetical protein
MSKLEVNAVEPQCGTNLTLGASGDTIIIPSGATISNQGTAAGFGPTGAVSWDTTKITADPNPAVSGVGYFADTTSAAFTITLPATPAAGAVVGIADYANTFATNNLTVDRNGSNIGGVANDAILSTNGVSITFVYVDATQGWIVTDSGNRSDLPVPEYIVATGGTESCCGDYKIHTFTGPGTFTVTSAGNPLGSTTVDYLVVAGGGGSGLSGAGGGGAGGYRESSGAASGCYSASPLGSGVPSLPVSVQGYPITVGGGGAGLTVPSPAGPPFASRGSNSVFSTITSTGGGGSPSQSQAATPESTGGSGAGLGKSGPGSAIAGNTPPVAPPQGNPGGITGTATAGGGGGATSAGSTGKPAGPAEGGAGATSSINGTPTARAGGGGGGSDNCAVTGGAAGPGGGGIGGNRPDGGTSTNGTTNTGGGAGGTGENAGSGTQRNGGSGIVIIRYKFQ